LCAATKGIPAIRGGAAEPALLKIVVPDTRRRVNNTRRHAKECTSVFILWLRVRNANSILRGTTPVLGRSDTCYRENHNCPTFILEPSLEIKRVLRAEP